MSEIRPIVCHTCGMHETRTPSSSRLGMMLVLVPSGVHVYRIGDKTTLCGVTGTVIVFEEGNGQLFPNPLPVKRASEDSQGIPTSFEIAGDLYKVWETFMTTGSRP